MHILGEGILTERLQVPRKYRSARVHGKPGHLPGGAHSAMPPLCRDRTQGVASFHTATISAGF